VTARRAVSQYMPRSALDGIGAKQGQARSGRSRGQDDCVPGRGRARYGDELVPEALDDAPLQPVATQAFDLRGAVQKL
jgi:hypothetical protein